MRDEDRRQFLKLSAAVPLGAGAAAISAGGHDAHAAAGGTDLQHRLLPEPDYVLETQDKTIAPFGTEVRALLVNDSLPGTEIRYNKGDMFRVAVKNSLAEPTTIHWHGLILPNLLDGVPEVTQAPIEPRVMIHYEFRLRQAGTFWYHSHVGFQEQQGLSGALIIDDPNEQRQYDHDVTLFLSDVTDQEPEAIVAGLRSGALDGVKVPEPYLAQGEDSFALDIPYGGYLINGRPSHDPWTYAARRGDRVRLRVINGSGSSFFRFMIDELPLTVIASDGEDLEPVTVDNLVLGTAERYDLLVTIPDTGSYTLHAAALGDDKQVVGALHTNDVAPKVDTRRPSFSDRALKLEQLVSLEDSALPDAPTRVIENRFTGDMKGFVWKINDVLYPEVLAGPDAKNVPFEINYGEVVRLDMINGTPMYHPMHLHGHVFRILNGAGARAPRKDTVSVPPKSKMSIEFYADNPGMWFWHCHNLYHLATGMAREIRYVG